MNAWKKLGRIGSIGLLAASVLTSSFVFAGNARAFGAEPQLAVALYIKTDRYNALQSAVTLSSEGALSVTDELSRRWMDIAGGQALKMSLDGYRTMVMETEDSAKAEAVYIELKKMQLSAFVFTHTVKGKQRYRVYSGPYENKDQAEAARNTIAANSTISNRTGGGQPAIAGPFYAAAGSYATEAEARAAAVPLWDAGVYAVPAITMSETGAASYSLWVGESPDAQSLQQKVSQATALVKGLTLQSVPETARYMLLYNDVAGDSGLAKAPIRHAAIGGNGHMSVSPVTSGAAIRVTERFDRAYRGTIELSRYNGSLAVINRVGLESYVTSVVGSELDPSWPHEVLKAQAVAARTYALKQGLKYGIANVADTTSDQVYRGVEREFPAIAAAVQATAGETLVRTDGTLLDAFYHSNSGNMTAAPLEAWGTDIAGIASVPSPDDVAEQGKLTWYRIVLPDQRIGYVRSDLLRLTGSSNAAGFPKAEAKESGVNVRMAPYVNNETNPGIAQLAADETVTIIGEDIESTSYRWIRGPISGSRLQSILSSNGASIGLTNPLYRLSVTKRGATTGRVTELAANETAISVARPEEYRTLLGLPSTRFDVEETAVFTVLGAGGRQSSINGSGSVNAAGANGAKVQFSTGAFLVYDGGDTARVMTAEPGFRFHGYGFGHGLGMSQWGAYGLAELGYDYRKILQYYYNDAIVSKG